MTRTHHTSTAATRSPSPRIGPRRRALLSNSCTAKSGKRLGRMSVVNERGRWMRERLELRACSSMPPKDSGCIGIIERRWWSSCAFAFLYYSGLVGLIMAMPGPLFVSRDCDCHHATMADCNVLDIEYWSVSPFLTAVVGLGMPTVRFGISFRTQKTVHGTHTLHRRNDDPAAHHRTAQSTDPDHRKSTRRP